MRLRLRLTFFCMLLVPSLMPGQHIPVVQNDLVRPLTDRLRIRIDNPENDHTSHQYITRGEVRALLHSFDTLSGLNYRDKEDIQYLVDECLEGEVYMEQLRDSSSLVNFLPRWNSRPVFGLFYKTPANLLQADRKDFYFRLNPVFNFNYGRSNDELYSTTFKNIRGAEMRGGIAGKVWFYANLHETQEAYGAYVNEWIARYGAVPGAGFNKIYGPSFLKNTTGVDYLNSQGMIGFHIIPQIGLQLGHGRNFIGDGYRSLFLSDFAANYFYLRLNTKLWIFDYQNIFAELNATGQRSGDKLIPKKYFATHHLSLNLTPWLNIGLFESVVFSRNNNFELQYLNPVIFYRTIEQMVGSPDNAMLGADLRIKLGRSVKLYGQLLFDELQIKNLVRQNGWWGNKYGIQAGMQYFDVAGIDHLDMRLEYNMVRPYTYTDSDSSANYSHHLQPLAHPLGANFYEGILQLRYAPSRRWVIEPQLMIAVTGEDHDGANYGSNILLPNGTRPRDFGVDLAQGDRARIFMGCLDLSYMVYHNLFADLSLAYRKKDSASDRYDTKEVLVSAGLRMNISARRFLF